MVANKKPAWMLLGAVIVGLAIIAAGFTAVNGSQKQKAELAQAQQTLEQVISVASPKDSYDVIVVGTDPEGIAAAVSAARNGLSVLLTEGRERDMLGGLFTLGWLNSLDLNYAPVQNGGSGQHIFLNEGIFQEWYEQVKGTSFDTVTAANSFYRMVKAEPNLDLFMAAAQVEPIVESGATPAVIGLELTTKAGAQYRVITRSVIDATQDGDVAAAAGAPFTWGKADIGDGQAQMAVTLVFKLTGITQSDWEAFGRHKDTGVDAMSAWGFPEMAEYPSTNVERVRMRGLNIGRQNDGSILINAMQIFGVDPLDQQSVQEGMEIGKQEALHIVDYMKRNFKEFKHAKLAGTAPELYVRESRHLQGEYRLTMADLLENRDHWDAIAYGSYKVDIQSTHYKDPGNVLMAPMQYGVPFRSLVPLQVDGLLVVGRAASFDSLPHGSARVVPLGMATGQAAGAAAKLAAEQGLTFRELSASKEAISTLRERLERQGVDLTPHPYMAPAYMKHKAYAGLKAAVSMLITSGGYDNKAWDLDGPSNPQRFVYHLVNAGKAHAGLFVGEAGKTVKGMAEPTKQALTLEQAARTIVAAIGEGQANIEEGAAADIEAVLEGEIATTIEGGVAGRIDAGLEGEIATDPIDARLEGEPATTFLQAKGWVSQATLGQIADRQQLTNGEAFMLLRDLMEFYGNVIYE
jgi:hypothetical protein